MALNSNKKNYRLADMSITPDHEIPYPDPDERAEIIEDRVDMAEFGTVLNIREWRAHDDSVEQFAIMFDITPHHEAFDRCKALKGSSNELTHVRRTDTWHSTLHSHQFFIDSFEQEREVHAELVGGNKTPDSRRVVNAAFAEYYNELLYNPFEYLDRWEKGKQ